ncbi:hypothetical protein PC113_g18208, partial [Phytophthora cactorum]
RAEGVSSNEVPDDSARGVFEGVLTSDEELDVEPLSSFKKVQSTATVPVMLMSITSKMNATLERAILELLEAYEDRVRREDED